ncbi:hypothetical protein VKT23_013979 [Stygiomarasmius scandens]|uniref:EF-hand domain-containing protein n=1 Tax=Marasmiellus scandens TaxID=2682957 RepID=A0ABR1J266_9AGAR
MIDNDGSGNISVEEFNIFLKQKPNEWSPPEWFVFWAMGWQQLMLSASLKVANLEENVRKAASARRQSADETLLYRYMQALRLISNFVNWHQISGYGQYFAKDFSQYGVAMGDLGRLKRDYQNNTQTIFRELTLAEKDFELADPNDIKELQSKFDNRIEAWIVPFLAVVLEQHLKKINDEEGYEPTDDQWSSMNITLSILLYELYNRMQSLERQWRAQKLNLDLQATSFSGGILAAWYNIVHGEEHQEALQLIVSYFENGSKQEGSIPGDGTAITAELQSLRASVSELQSSVAELSRIIQYMQNNSEGYMARGIGGGGDRIQQQNDKFANEEAEVGWNGQDLAENVDGQNWDEQYYNREQGYVDYQQQQLNFETDE